jgi:hypothetical protein
LLAVNALANVPLNPDPLIPLAALAQVTPVPLESWENVKPVTDGDIVAVGTAGHVTDPIPVYDTVVWDMAFRTNSNEALSVMKLVNFIFLKRSI